MSNPTEVANTNAAAIELDLSPEAAINQCKPCADDDVELADQDVTVLEDATRFCMRCECEWSA